MVAEVVIGFEGVVYRNTGSYGSPTWVACPNVKDCKLAMEKGEGDATTRGNNGWEAVKGTLKKGSIEFSLQYTKSAGALPADVQAFLDAYLNGTLLECLVLDGPIDTAGSQGLRASMEVMKFERDEPLDGLMVANISIKPGYSDHPPEWHEET